MDSNTHCDRFVAVTDLDDLVDSDDSLDDLLERLKALALEGEEEDYACWDGAKLLAVVLGGDAHVVRFDRRPAVRPLLVPRRGRGRQS
jgi:hypothetical protein